MTRSTWRRAAFLTVLLLGALGLGIGMGSVSLRAQEGRPPVFGPQEVLPMFFRALQEGDLLILRDGSVVSGRLEAESFTLQSETLGTQTLPREDVVAVVFANPEEEGAEDRLYTRSGERLAGQLQLKELPAELALEQRVSLDPARVKAVLLQMDLHNPRRRPNPAIFRQLFGLFSDLLVSVTKFDLLVFPNRWVASVVLENRGDLAFTLDSPIFGTFTFEAPMVAAVIFGRGENDPDVLVLQNGDRVSGRVTGQSDLSGTIAGFPETAFHFPKEALREELSRIVLKIPVRLFGGGGGRPVGPREGD